MDNLNSPLDTLRQLKEMLDAGALTPTEFEALKQRLVFNNTPAVPASPAAEPAPPAPVVPKAPETPAAPLPVPAAPPVALPPVTVTPPRIMVELQSPALHAPPVSVPPAAVPPVSPPPVIPLSKIIGESLSKMPADNGRAAVPSPPPTAPIVPRTPESNGVPSVSPVFGAEALPPRAPAAHGLGANELPAGGLRAGSAPAARSPLALILSIGGVLAFLAVVLYLSLNRPPSEHISSTSQTAADSLASPIETGPQAQQLPQPAAAPETVRVAPAHPAPPIRSRPAPPVRDTAAAPTSAPPADSAASQ